MGKICYIYILIDPTTKEIRYVGQSIYIWIRLSQHISEAKHKNLQDHKNRWIRKLLRENNKPIIKIIDICNDGEESDYLESIYIKFYKNIKKCNLTNSQCGGKNGSRIMSEETKKKQKSANMVNAIKSKKTIQKAVLQYDLNGNFIKKFNSITEASEICKIQLKLISKVCTKKRKSTGGYQWKFKSGSIKRKIKPVVKQSFNERPIIQLSPKGKPIKEFPSEAEATRFANSSVRQAINRNGFAGGFKWKWKHKTHKRI